MPDPTDKEWQGLVEVLGPVADTVDDKFVEEQAKDEEGKPDDSTEGSEGKDAKDSKEEAPFKAFKSKKELEDYMDNAFSERFERVKTKNEREKREAEEEAKRQALKDQEKYKELYEAEQERIESLESRVKELEPLEESNSNYRSTLDSYAKAQIDELELPRGVTKLLDGMDPQEKLDWLTENKTDFAATETIPEGEAPDDSGSPEADEKAREEYGASVHRMI